MFVHDDILGCHSWLFNKEIIKKTIYAVWQISLEYHVKCLFIKCKAVLPIFDFKRHFKKQFSSKDYSKLHEFCYLLEGLHFLNTHNWKWSHGLVKLKILFKMSIHILTTIIRNWWFEGITSLAHGDFLKRCFFWL